MVETDAERSAALETQHRLGARVAATGARSRAQRSEGPRTAPHPPADIVIVGAGAAGLMAAVWAGRTAPGRRIVVLDGARKPGAKILIAGGGRCNVTHDHVDASAFAGSSRKAIEKVLRRFDVPQTVAFFEELGVGLEREDTGKLFPATGRARTVLDALLRAAREAHVAILHPRRVESVIAVSGGFAVNGAWGRVDTRYVVLATGGTSVPKTGSDGHGYEIARTFGHTITTVFPALVPLTLPKNHFITRLSGLTVDATLDVISATGKRLASFTGSTLCTHFGLSGPTVLDISRFYIEAVMDDPRTGLTINWLPEHTPETFENELLDIGNTSVSGHLGQFLPDRLAAALCTFSHVDPKTPGHQLQRDDRKTLARAVTRLLLPITGNRGFDHAEVTAGGIPLTEIRLDTMESRLRPGLYVCGEICDVDGRIGGFNFHWAWSSGYTAGVSVGRADGPRS
jgi:predicted Rossmann fold flavoprotein